MTDFEKPRDPAQQPPDPIGAGGAPGPSADAPPPDGIASNAGANAGTPPAGFDERGKVKRGRASTVWSSLIAATVVLVLLIVFIAQNLKDASIHFLGFSGRMPTGLAILIAAIVGVLLAAIPGSIRILQLRRSLKHNMPKDARGPHDDRAR